MSYVFIGFYYCHYEDADVEDPNSSANIYLYVNGKSFFHHINNLFIVSINGPNVKVKTFTTILILNLFFFCIANVVHNSFFLYLSKSC